MTKTSHTFDECLRSTVTNTGENLADFSAVDKTLVVFLRHGGCTFCREALEDIRRSRDEIERSDTRLVLVHMMTEEEAAELFSRYGLGDIARVSDPDRSLYAEFGLQQGQISQLLAFKVWWRGLVAGILHRHGAGRLQGDGRQMPGVFLLANGKIVHAFRHKTAADRPDYTGMACTVTSEAKPAGARCG